MKFTNRVIESLRPKDKRHDVWEDGRNGFGVRVSVKGRVSWQYMYRFDGKARRMTLGKFPAMGLADAHTAHAIAEKLRETGIDPGEEKVQSNKNYREAPNVDELIDDYLSHSTKKTVGVDRIIFNRDVIPFIGYKKAEDIKRRDINALLDRIVKRGAPVAAN